jgi:hypothetical protein
MFEDMQLEEWTRLGGLSGLTLCAVKTSHHATLVAVLPRLTGLCSLVLKHHVDCVDGLQATGACCFCYAQLLRPTTVTTTSTDNRSIAESSA